MIIETPTCIFVEYFIVILSAPILLELTQLSKLLVYSFHHPSSASPRELHPISVFQTQIYSPLSLLNRAEDDNTLLTERGTCEYNQDANSTILSRYILTVHSKNKTALLSRIRKEYRRQSHKTHYPRSIEKRKIKAYGIGNSRTKIDPHQNYILPLCFDLIYDNSQQPRYSARISQVRVLAECTEPIQNPSQHLQGTYSQFLRPLNRTLLCKVW